MFRPPAHLLAGLALCFAAAPTSAAPPATPKDHYDVVIYGGTSAGVIAAVQATRLGKTVVVVGPDTHLGGLSSGGLGWTDSGNKAAVGGLSRDFYHRVWNHYQQPAGWKWQQHEQYGNRGQGSAAADGDSRTMWVFEPHVAEGIFEDYIREFKIPLFRDEWLDREQGVKVENGRIVSIGMLSGKAFRGSMFIDATYEGDLMAAAGVSYTVGREGNDVYDETLNGVQARRATSHQFTHPVSAYKVPGDPSSGLLPRVHAGGPGKEGTGDNRIQAYCYRLCMTNHAENRVPFPKPDGYDASQYELLLRSLLGDSRHVFGKFDPLPNHKTDTNNHGPFSTDNIGMNYDYPNGSYERRNEILKEHQTYQKGYLYFLCNDPRVPADVREKMNHWGLAADEFKDNANWPHQIYVREARRMVSEYVQTEHDCRRARICDDPIGLGSYNMDSHNVQRYVDADGHARNEGDIQVSPGGSYAVSYRAIVPKRGEIENLLVPVCLSASHIAYGSIRMEPVFMVLGQSAATAAAIAIDQRCPVQAVPYMTLRKRLDAEGQQLTPSGKASSTAGIAAESLPGVVIDDAAATFRGDWPESRSVGPFVGSGYRHDDDAGKEATAAGKTATFAANLPPGRYEVRLAYTPNANRATNVPVTVRHAGQAASQTVDQRAQPPLSGLWVSLGTYSFDGTAAVELSTAGTNGHVIADAVQFLPAE